MNQQIKLNSDRTAAAPIGVHENPPATVPDADIQAILDMGELAYLAATYESLVQNHGDPALIAKTLQQFQTLYSYYHFNSNGTITFDYNEGAEPGTVITDPETIQLLQLMPKMSNPPTAADVANYLNNFWYATTPPPGQNQTIIQGILEYLIDTKFTMSNNLNNTITNTSVLLFYLSLANAPGAEVSGILDQFVLSVGLNGPGWISLGNIYYMTNVLCAHLKNDTTLLSADVIDAGLNISTNDKLLPVLGKYFHDNYQAFMANPMNESLAWWLEGYFFPQYSTKQNKSFFIGDTTDRRTDVNKEMSKAERRSPIHRAEELV